jgi:hypothetical protein
MPLSFPPGSADGATQCASLTANADDLVEGEEGFTVALAISTLGASFRLGNAVTAVTITDADGMIFFTPAK